MIKCNQKPSCDNPPAYRYTWPGQDEAYICFKHAAWLDQVANAMGTYLQLFPLTAQDYLNAEKSDEQKGEK